MCDLSTEFLLLTFLLVFYSLCFYSYTSNLTNIPIALTGLRLSCQAAEKQRPASAEG